MTYFKKFIHYHASLGVGSIWLLKRSIIFQRPQCAVYLGMHVPSAFMNCVVPMNDLHQAFQSHSSKQTSKHLGGHYWEPWERQLNRVNEIGLS